MKLVNILALITLFFLLSSIVIAAPKSSWQQNAFWFRDDNGTETSATGFGNVSQDTSIVNISPGTSFRLRFGIGVNALSGTISPKIEFKEGAGCTTGTWMPITSFTPNFILQESPNFNDYDSTSQQITSRDFVAGEMLESTNLGLPTVVPKGDATEFEWSLKALDDVLFDTQYSFRVTNSGDALNSYSKCPSLTIIAAPVIPTSGGAFVRQNIVIFEGRAFPGAEVFLIEKLLLEDKLIKQRAEISMIGDFTIIDMSVPVGYHTFSLMVRDIEGRQAQTKTYNIDYPGEYFAIKNILIPPTIGLVRSVIKKGEPLEIIGYASFLNRVIIEINNVTYRTRAGEDGSYHFLINDVFPLGRYSIKIKQQDFSTGRESDFSTTKNFSVSDFKEITADFNDDGTINIADWSIFLALWKDKDERIDLNMDGEINIGDLSVFLQEFKSQ